MEYDRLPDMGGWAALRAVVERGGVNGAAKVLNIGQPAVTKRLRALDACYGMPMMERYSGRLRLTEAGEKVYLLAVQALDRHRVLQEELQQNLNLAHSMRMETTFAIAEHLLPDLLLAFQEHHPEYRVESRVGYNRTIQTNVAAGMADLALLEDAPEHSELLVQRWMDDELWLVCGASHPLAGVDLLPLERLGELSFVLRERRSSIRDYMDEALDGVGIRALDVAMEIGSSDAIIEMLRRGRHVSFMPRFAVRERVAEGILARIKITGFRIRRTLWICRNRSRLDHPVVEAFIDTVRRHMEGQ
jgi:DNA-binding transcriptional LysR family regulator